jgi:hypothetical protein
MAEVVLPERWVFVTDVTVGGFLVLVTSLVTIFRLYLSTKSTFKAPTQQQVFSAPASLDTSIDEGPHADSIHMTQHSGQRTLNGSVSTRSSVSLSLVTFPVRTIPSEEGMIVDLSPHLDKSTSVSFPSFNTQVSSTYSTTYALGINSGTSPLKKTSSVLQRDSSLSKFETTVRDKWMQPVEELSTHIDLPRLIIKIEVFSNGKCSRY